MKTFIKTFITLALVGLVLIPVSTQFTVAKTDQISAREEMDGITITTDYLTLKLPNNKPQFLWWNGNQSSADIMYNVQFTGIKEFFGNDTTLDSADELNGQEYNFKNLVWDTNIDDSNSDRITVSLTLSGLANGAEIQFIVRVFTMDVPVNGTDTTIKALSQVKFDIVVNNWKFTEGAQGLAVRSLVLEAQKRERIRIRNGTASQNGTITRIQFENENGKRFAFYDWANFADVYNNSEKIDTIPVGTSYFNEQGSSAPANSETVNVWLSYPNYGDGLRLVHDPSIGVLEGTNGLSLYLLPALVGLATITVVAIIRKQKNNH